jgi:hypothetical protein
MNSVTIRIDEGFSQPGGRIVELTPALGGGIVLSHRHVNENPLPRIFMDRKELQEYLRHVVTDAAINATGAKWTDELGMTLSPAALDAAKKAYGVEA